MSTEAQIKANQQNAKLSTGPITPAGRERSSKNATTHGFTGQTLIVTPQEKESYDAHVAAYMAAHNPTDHHHKQLVQQFADANWSLHQIFVQQTNVMVLMNAIMAQMAEAGSDPIATAAAIAPVSRSPNTLSTYEVRRRRAAKSIQEELAALEKAISEQQPTPNPAETKTQPNVGSVCSWPPNATAADSLRALLDQEEAMLLRMEAEAGIIDPIENR